MIPTNDKAVFLQKNYTELNRMISKVALDYHYRGHLEDLIQDFYLKILTSDIIESYRQDFHGPETVTKISTYIYPMIKNFIIMKFRTKDYRFSNFSLSNQDEGCDDGFFDSLKKASDYDIEVIDHNQIVEENEHAEEDINFIKDKFEEMGLDKMFPLDKKKDKSFEAVEECTLLNIFRHLYDGFTNRDIARMYGVSYMYITYLKQYLAKRLMKKGLKPFFKACRPEILYCKIKGLEAAGYFAVDGFIVLKDSEAVLKERECVKKFPWPLYFRQKLKEEGILIVEENCLVFSKDYKFSAPSTAASIIYGGHAGGLTAWKNKDGKCLKDLQLKGMQYDHSKMPKMPVCS